MMEYNEIRLFFYFNILNFFNHLITVIRAVKMEQDNIVIIKNRKIFY